MEEVDNSYGKKSFTTSAEDILGRVNKMIMKNREKQSEDEEDVLELLEEVSEDNTQEMIIQDTKIEQEVFFNNNKDEIEEDIGMTKTLVSENTVEATSALINQLKQTAKSKQELEAMKFRSGTTVEDVVIELIKPHLSQWLNENLPTIVKNAVEKEVKKLIPNED